MTRPAFLANLAATLMKADLLLVYEVDQAVVSDALIGGATTIWPDGHPEMVFKAEEVRVTARGGQKIQGWRYAL
jgi:hypothetical protein